MRPPEEIKRELAEAPHIQYAADDPSCVDGYGVRYAVAIGYVLRDNIVSYIQQLESRLAQVERERNAAVFDIAVCKLCRTCEEDATTSDYGSARCHACFNKSNWQWRGVCAENTEEG